MAHESWWVREFQLLPLHNPLLTHCKFFLTICFCFRFQQVKLVLELIFEAVQTLVRIVVLLQQSIRDLHQIISMAHDGWESISTSSSPISHYWRSVNFTVILTILFFFFRFQQVVSILELIVDVVGSYVSLVGLLRRLIGTCRAIWSICTARQPAAVANDPQNEVPPTDAEESNIWSLRFQEDLSCTCNTTFTSFTVHNM